MITHAVDQFLRLGYTTAPFPFTRDLITATTLFNQLVEVFTSVQLENVCFDNEGNPTDHTDDRTDLGYIQRKGEPHGNGRYYDQKTFLHYAGEERLERALARNNPDFLDTARWLLQANKVVYALCQSIISDFARELDPHLGEGLNLSSRVGQPDDKLRTLAYQGSKPGSREIGQAHCDQSGLTLAIYQSTPGLQLWINGEWQEITNPNGVATIFAGRRLEKFTGGQIAAMPHRILSPIDSNKNTGEGRKTNRLSMVFFSNIQGIDLD